MTVKAKVNGVKFKIPIVVEKDGDEYYAHSPVLKGLHMGGATENEALCNARDAAIAILEVMIEDGESIPLSILEPEKLASTRSKKTGIIMMRKYW